MDHNSFVLRSLTLADIFNTEGGIVMIRGLHRRFLQWGGILRFASCLLALGFLLSACGGGGDGGGSSGGGTGAEQISFSGRAMVVNDAMGGFSQPIAMSGITVTVSTDIDANGSIDGTERASATTDSDGNFTISAPVEVGTRTVVSFEEQGYATQLKAIDINSLSPVTGVDVTLSQMRTLTETGDGWQDSGNSVRVSDIDIASGTARAFNPATESDRFPGEFADDQGNMLLSGVFAAFDLRDSQGRTVRSVSAANPATVRMKIPRDTWGVLKDLDTSTVDVIDVPMYYFDEETGEWVREGSGYLEDGEGNTITAAQLTTITSTPATFTGTVYSVSEATHFSYWNLDFPVDTHACVGGIITDADGMPVAGAGVSITGLSYTGNSAKVYTDDTGRYCTDVMRNEATGEDLDGDGITGETQELSLMVRSGNKIFQLEQFQLTSGQGSCPNGCMILDFQLLPANEVESSCCTISGKVNRDGLPLGNASVIAYDETIRSDYLNSLCPDPMGFIDQSLADGSFEVSAEMSAALKLYAHYSDMSGDVDYYYWGQRNFASCPTTEQTISVELLFCVAELTVAVSGQQISWTPNVAVNTLYVTDTNQGSLKWVIYSETGFSSPVTFGTLPAGATEQTAASGSLAATDMVLVNGRFTDSGNLCFNSGVYTGY
jgi:hypothetical protein